MKTLMNGGINFISKREREKKSCLRLDSIIFQFLADAKFSFGETAINACQKPYTINYFRGEIGGQGR